MKYIKKFGRKFLMIYWRIFKPLSLGTRVMVIHKDKILLVKHTYVGGYFFPGGGVKKSENFRSAAIRELYEETHIKASSLDLFGIYQSTKEKKYTVNVLFICKLSKKPHIIMQKDELIEVAFFPISNLPMGTSPGTRRRVNEYLKKQYPSVDEW